uniref:Selenocysteine-specific elongation factor n=1 Tax=Strigamia maritima TaxID=126957 RepID=T1IQA6_STRMM
MASKSSVLNFNVGVLGHIDSGKTALAKVLSTTASTACFDKNPQSKERGITLDLGFSSFRTSLPDQLKNTKYDELQVTLVDCPGHASLIRTIIGGAQIIDLMMLVVDITKGIQTQTAECLVLGEITCGKMIIILNKIDLIPLKDRESGIAKVSKKLKKILEKTKFANANIIPVAAKPGGPDALESEMALGIGDLVEEFKKSVYLPERLDSGPFVFAVDHCFSIRGQGTVMTGTITSGKVQIGDMVEISSMKITRKVKSMQMFHQPVDQAMQGDRLGICVTQFDPKQLERGLVCTPNTLETMYAAITSIDRIPYFKGLITTKSKFHISIGHETVMAKLNLFTSTEPTFNFKNEYSYMEQISDTKSTDGNTQNTFALLEFERPISAVPLSLVIGSRLDTDIHLNACRLAFKGKLLHWFEDKNYPHSALPQLKVFKMKCKEGFVDRLVNEFEVIGRGLLKKETSLAIFTNLKVKLSTGEDGVIEGGFGQSGKIKIRIPAGLAEETVRMLGGFKKKGKEKATGNADGTQNSVKISLDFKKYLYDAQNKIIQS